MSSSRIIRHIQGVLNQCGDPVFLQPTGNETLADPGRMSIEINMVMLKKQNNCFTVPVPNPSSSQNTEDGFWINRVRLSTSMIDDYSKNFPFTDEDIKSLISKSTILFGCR